MRWFKNKNRNKKKHIPKCCWCPIIGTVLDDEYREICQLLGEAGMDYRVWMDADNPEVILRRELASNPDKYRRHYHFYIKRFEYRKGCRVLNIDRNSMYRFVIS